MSTGHVVRPDGTINTGAKHTPGPWTVDKDWITNKSGVKIFSIDQDEDAPHEQGFDCNQTTLAQVYDSEANARLIAAAPELLEALQNFVESIDLIVEGQKAGDLPKTDKFSAYGRIQKSMTYIKAKEAIQKATE